MANLVGTWTVPGKPLRSSHLLRRNGIGKLVTRCGIYWYAFDDEPTTPEPSGRGATCESCLRLSRRDG